MESLMLCSANHMYEFVGFTGTESEEQHLRHLGLTEGTTLHIIAKPDQQSLIIFFRQTRLGLDASIADKIKVVPKGVSALSSAVPLSETSIGQTTRVVKLLGTGSVKRRLMDMGLTKGTVITVRKYAPMGDPIEVTVRNYELTLRKAEAEMILVEKGEQ